VRHNNARLKTWVEKPFCQAMIIEQKYKKKDLTQCGFGNVKRNVYHCGILG